MPRETDRYCVYPGTDRVKANAKTSTEYGGKYDE